MKDLPEGVDSAMFLRDGWPYAVVCKVVMKDGCVGIGVYRWQGAGFPAPDPELSDKAAMTDAMTRIAPEPPDYTPLHEYVARQAAEAKARYEQPEPDHDLQATLGQKAHD